MATSAQMIAAGVAFFGDTFLLIYSAWVGDKIFKPLYTWYLSFQYSTAPTINPGIVLWVPRLYFGMLICMWFGLLFALYYLSTNKVVNQWGY